MKSLTLIKVGITKIEGLDELNLLEYKDIEYDNSLPGYPRQIKFYTPDWGKNWIVENDL